MTTRCSSSWLALVITLALTSMLVFVVSNRAVQAEFGPDVDVSGDVARAELLSLSASQSGNWEIETVLLPEKLFDEMTDRSLRVDADGHPHVVYGESHLFYAWHDGAKWNYEVVDDSPQVGLYAALAFDGEGQPHISYWNWSDFDLKYAHRNASGWHIETVQSEGTVGAQSSIAVDANGYPHISYRDYGSGVMYAHLDASGWHTGTVNPAMSGHTSLALDGEGRPHISYASSSNRAEYAYLDVSGWHTETVAAGAFGRSSLELDEEDYPHISYVNYDAGLMYARLTSSGWVTEVVDSPPVGSVGSPSLALDNDGRPWISYEVLAEDDLKMAYLTTAGWYTETVDSEGLVGRDTSLALDSDGRAHVSYQDLTNDGLKYAHWDGSVWHTETVDEEFDAGEAGQYTSLALDSDGYPHISCYNITYEDLMYVYRDPSGWQATTVDSEGDVGKYTSLALDGDDHAHISYVDDPQNDLKYAHYDGAVWNRETVDSWSGWHTSLALEPTAPYRPHISYSWYGFLGTTDPARRVSYAYLGTEGWQISTVDDGGTTRLVGYGTSLALDGEGYPRISYESQDGSGNDRVRYTYWNESGRYTQQVDSRYSNLTPAYVGISMALEPTAPYAPHISYYDKLSGYLKYAYWDGSEWSKTIVDTTGDVGQYSSLALDSRGNPHISYYDDTNKALKYTRFDGTMWISETVDSAVPTYITVGEYTSLALDEHDQPHISYYETGKLKYAHFVAAPADLSVAKTVTPATAAPGDTIAYTIVFSNTGSGRATGVVLADDIPDGVINTSVVSSGADITQRAGTRYTWDVADLAHGEGGTITVTGEVGDSAPATFANTAFISSTTRDPNPDNDSASALLTLEGEPPQNTPPTISDIPDQSTEIDTPLVVPFVVHDAETPLDDLVLTAESSDSTLVPKANIVLEGSGTDRTATITPAAGETGMAVIAITVSDGELSDDESFTLAVGINEHIYLPLVLRAHTGP